MFQTPYRQRRGYEITCAATGTECRNLPTTLKINGQRIPSLLCQFHACRQVEGGRACPIAKLPRAVLCSQHMRCQAVDNGTRCTLDVKDGNPAVHKYCSQLHLCEFPECQNQRSWRNELNLLFCSEHRCEYGNCRNSKNIGLFCRPHTCDDPYCAAFASGTDIDDPQRFCERHRKCQRPQCPRLCHTRDNGQPSPFCGAHYCEAADCEDSREGGSHCRVHTCTEPGCLKGRESPRSEYCKEHTCRTRHCHLRRLGREYCPYHECVYDGCEAEVVEGRFCESHQRHLGAGVGGRRSSSQGMGYTIYEDHLHDLCPGINDRRGCGRRAEQSSQFCQHHICQVRDCREPRTRPSEFCVDHKCLVIECSRPRQIPVHRLIQSNVDNLFCEDHCCSHVGCRNQSVEESGWCLEHGGNRLPRFRQRLVEAEDERGDPSYRRSRMRPDSPRDTAEGRRRDGQRRLGWAETRHRDPWAAWGMAT